MLAALLALISPAAEAFEQNNPSSIVQNLNVRGKTQVSDRPCEPTDGRYDPSGSLSWEPSCGGAWIASKPNAITVYPVVGATSSAPNRPYIPNPERTPRTQVLIQAITQGEEVPENALTINMWDRSGGSALRGNDQKVGIYSLTRASPDGASMPGDLWNFNPDIVIAAGSGDLLGINSEYDFNNFNKDCPVGGPCFQVMHWDNFLSSYPIIAIHYMQGTTSTFTGTVDTKGTAVTRIAGSAFTDDISTITINGALYRVRTFVDSSHLTLTASAGSQAKAAFSANAHAAHDGFLLSGDNLVKENDWTSSTSAYNLIQANGHHHIAINTAADAAPYALLAAQGQNICLNTFDACFSYAGANETRFLQAGGIAIAIGGVASSVNYLRTQSDVGGFGPTLSASGSDSNIDLNLQPKGAGSINLLSPAKLANKTIAATLALLCNSAHRGDQVFVHDTVGAAAATFGAAVAGGGAAAINRPATCDGATWRY